MSTSIERLLAMRAGVGGLIRGRRRLVIAWCFAVFGLFGTAAWAASMSWSWAFWLLCTYAVLSWLWVATESAAVQRTMGEGWIVCGMYFFSAFVPGANAIIAVSMLQESSAVVEIDRRMQKQQCVRCRYDLRGISGPNCPECGEVMIDSEVR